MRRLVMAAAAWAAGVAFAPAAFAQTSTADGVFTAEQAARGKEAYDHTCAPCHGGNLIATDDEATNLTGTPFNFGWRGKTISERWSRVFGTMPPNNPASLPEETYLDIITYILEFNGMPAGDEELTLDFDRLDQIVVEPAAN